MPGREVESLTAALFAAIAFLLVVHRTVFAGFFAALFVRRKTCCANHGREDRHQDGRRGFHLN
jgi:hypothetical protein